MGLKMKCCRQQRLCIVFVVAALIVLVLMSNVAFLVSTGFLKSMRGVAFVEAQVTAASEAINWAAYQINAPTAWTQSTGAGIKIAVLDTGVGPVDDVKVYGGYNFVDNNQDITDRHGHGTVIASIIAATHTNSATGLLGIAPNAQIYAVKIMDDQGNINLERAILGVRWAIDNDMQIISISWCINDRNNALKQVLDEAYSKGILIVAAAGNTGEVAHGVGCPAVYSSTIAVSAIKEDKSRLEVACTGEEIELTGPGAYVYGIGPGNSIYWGTGTSFAVPYVTGTAALVWAKNASLTNMQVRDILCKTATDLQPFDGLERDIFFGYGLINATAAIQAATTSSVNNPNDNGTSQDTPSGNSNSNNNSSGGGGGGSSAQSVKEQPKQTAEELENSKTSNDLINWAANKINAPTAWTQSTGTGIKIAILDTGVNPINDLKVYGGYNFVNNNQDTTDHNGHGTMMASIIAATHTNTTTGLLGIAPDAQIYAVKIMDDQGNINVQHTISGIQWAIDNNMQIISIGWYINDQNNALKQILETAYNKGILIIAATGNTEKITHGIGYPAEYSSTIAVTAIKENTHKLEQASTGTEIELAAPGENIYTIGLDNKIHLNTGTDYATMYVTGVAALVWAKNPSLTNTQVRNILRQTATNLQGSNGSNRDTTFGYGLINATAAIQAAPNFTNPPNNTLIIIISIVSAIAISVTLLTIRYNKTKNQPPTNDFKT